MKEPAMDPKDGLYPSLKINELYDQLLTSLSVSAQWQEVPKNDRLHVISAPSPEGQERKIKTIESVLLAKYGTTKGAIFIDTGIVRPWDDAYVYP
jgi:hypothetical protein